MRHLILHYHLFKNAGTSLDRIFKKNFGAAWREQEFWKEESRGAGGPSVEVAAFVSEHPDMVVLSSHTALLPDPVLPETTIYPVLFVRHPVDRIRSIYEFERRQNAETEGAMMAKKLSMSEFIEWRLERKNDRAVRDFQAYRLAKMFPAEQNGVVRTERERAIEALDTLPLVGVVEHFDRSLKRLEQWLKPVFRDIHFEPTKANVTQEGNLTLSERLDRFRQDIGAATYMKVVKANENDQLLYDLAVEKLRG